MANLYFLAGTDPDDLENDLALFVHADTPQMAVEFWSRYYWEDTSECPFVPTFIAGESDPMRKFEHMDVYIIVPDPTCVGVVIWGDKGACEHVGHVLAVV